MTDEMYARIREVADEHGGKVEVSIAHPGLRTPVIAHPGEDSWVRVPGKHSFVRRSPEVYMTEADLVDFRARIAVEGLRREEDAGRWAGLDAERLSAVLAGAYNDIINTKAEPTTSDYSRYLDCVYSGRHIDHAWPTPCPLCGGNSRDFDARPRWQ